MISIVVAPLTEIWDEQQRPEAIKGTLGCFPDFCLVVSHYSERRVGFGECGNLRGAPELPLCSPPALSLLFSQRAKRENAGDIMPPLLHLD